MDVGQHRPVALDKNRRHARVCQKDMVVIFLKNFVGFHDFIICVPTPWSVKNSKSKACGMRASTMWVLLTPPPFKASTHEFTLGIMPPTITSPLMSSSTWVK